MAYNKNDAINEERRCMSELLSVARKAEGANDIIAMAGIFGDGKVERMTDMRTEYITEKHL